VRRDGADVNAAARTPDTEQLLEDASRGDSQARHALLVRHRDRLLRMISVRMDRRLSARIDPADVLQEAMADAWRRLPEYLEKRPVAFYPWLRRIAWERLAKLHRFHLEAKKRSVRREMILPLPSQSSATLADRLVSPGTSPSQKAESRENRERVRAALAELPERDREVLVLLYLERLSVAEAAAVLEVTDGAVKMRHVRALKRLRPLLAGDESGRDSNAGDDS